MPKFAAIAAEAAPGMFSMTPLIRSCRPRCATGRAVSQSGARKLPLRSGNLKNAFDLDRRIRREGSDADGCAGVTALVAEGKHHQVGRAVQHLRPFEKVGRGIDEAAEPDHPNHLV